MAIDSSPALHDNDIPRSDFVLRGWETTPKGLIVLVLIRSAQLNIHVQTDNFHRSPIALDSLMSNKAKFGSEHDEPGLWDYLEDVASYFVPRFRQLVPQVNHVGKLTLADLQLHRRYRGRLQFYDDVACLSAIIEAESEKHDGSDCDHFEPAPITWPFPRFKPSDVEVPYEDPTAIFENIPKKVFVQGESLF